MIPRDVLEAVCTVVNEYAKTEESLQLDSIARTIEQSKRCQIFIQPWKTKPSGNFASCVATCQTCVIRDTGIPPLKQFVALPIRHHFIFYTPYPEDVEMESVQIAHELGHCVLHWPLNDRAERLIWGTDIDAPDLYLVRYTKKEEQHADAFSCLVTAHQSKPSKRLLDIQVNEQVLQKVDECAGMGLLHSLIVH